MFVALIGLITILSMPIATNAFEIANITTAAITTGGRTTENFSIVPRSQCDDLLQYDYSAYFNSGSESTSVIGTSQAEMDEYFQQMLSVMTSETTSHSQLRTIYNTVLQYKNQEPTMKLSTIRSMYHQQLHLMNCFAQVLKCPSENKRIIWDFLDFISAYQNFLYNEYSSANYLTDSEIRQKIYLYYYAATDISRILLNLGESKTTLNEAVMVQFARLYKKLRLLPRRSTSDEMFFAIQGFWIFGIVDDIPRERRAFKDAVISCYESDLVLALPEYDE